MKGKENRMRDEQMVIINNQGKRNSRVKFISIEYNFVRSDVKKK